MERNIKIHHLFIFLMAVSIVLEGRSVWMYLTKTGGLVRAATKVLLFGSFLGLCLTKRTDRQEFLKYILWTAAISLYVLGYGLINRYAFRSLVLWLICLDVIIVEMCLFEDKVQENGIPLLMDYYCRLIMVIAAVSLFFWFFGGLTHLIPCTGEYIYTWADKSAGSKIYSYFDLYYTVGPQKAIGLTIDRNSAIFAEAPMAALHFSLALLIEMCLKKSTTLGRKILLIGAILSTLSTTAIIVALIAHLGKYFIRKTKNPSDFILKLGIVGCGLVVAYLLISKMVLLKMQQLSAAWRINDYEVAYTVWKENIFFGVGFQNDTAIQNAMPAWRLSNMGFSNSIMQLLAQGGIVFSIPYLICFMYGIWSAYKYRNMELVIFIVLFIFLFILTVYTYNYFTIMMLVYMLIWKKRNSYPQLVQLII